MNLLIYVLTLIMAVSILTYGRFRTFIEEMTMRKAYHKVMEKRESVIHYDAQYNKYKNHKAKEGESHKRSEARSKLDISLLLDFEKRQKHPERFNEEYILLSRLMHVLYADEPFFQKLHPNWIQEIVDRIIRKSDTLPPDQKITQIKQLANLDLENERMQETLVNMLKGGDYLSLFGSISTTKTALPPIRVYLASQALLEAIYQDKNFVDQILDKRNQLYSLVSSNRMSAHDATKEFRGLFSGRQSADISGEFLDFAVNKSRP